LKFLYFLVIFLLFVFSACNKQPKACIEVSPNLTAYVFDTLTLASCSENAESFEWEIELPLDSLNTSNEILLDKIIYKSWAKPGEFDVSLTAVSAKGNKQDKTTEVVIVKDLCYQCVNDLGAEYFECASVYLTKKEFDDQLNFWLSNGYTCVTSID